MPGTKRLYEIDSQSMTTRERWYNTTGCTHVLLRDQDLDTGL